ncbi:MAG TPA: homocysteine S-methyltransferase family protein [Paracoccaceae bacterium]|nr:homocysteine S-methyltransferase family protein [Paracoccaceae bacterium]
MPPLMLSDSGMETTLVCHAGRDLPAFAAFPLLDEEPGRDWLDRYYDRHLTLAADHGMGFVIDTPTWRASADWGPDLGYDAAALARVNHAAVAFCRAVADRWAGRVAPVLVAGVIGPRGDGYVSGTGDAHAAQDYHAPQIAALAEAGADRIAAYTLSTPAEATGIARAARAAGIPVTLSFTLETDGCLPCGTALGNAIAAVDAATGGYPDFYMINCAHPTHFAHVFDDAPGWAARIGGLKANASRLSHAELDACTTLDDGDPDDLAARTAALRRMLPALRLLGGCCGTDHRHVAAIARACHAPA